MNEYSQYVTTVNKIFDYLEKMKAGWDSLDNLNYIESVEEYKNAVIKYAEVFKTPKPIPMTGELETLGDD